MSNETKLTEEQALEAAKDENTPDETLVQLSNHKVEEVRIAVFENENTHVLTKIEMAEVEISLDALEVYSKDIDENVRQAVAWNENASIHTKVEMAEVETSPTVQMALAENNGLTHNDLLSNENTASDVLEYIYDNDRENEYDFELATHHNTPIEISTDILRNTDSTLIFETIDRFNYNWEERVALIENNNLDGHKRLEMTREEEDPRAILALANSEVEGVRMHSAENPFMPQEILAEMAQENIDTRDGVARNQGASVEILTELLQDKDEEVREAAAENLATRSEEQAQEAKSNFFAELEAKRQVEKAQEDPHHQ